MEHEINITNRRQFVADNFYGMATKEIAEKFKVTTKTIDKDAKFLGLESKRKKGSNLINKDYSPEEIQFIKDNRHLTAKELSEALNRPFHGLKAKLKTLKLSIHKKKVYTKEEDQYITTHLNADGFKDVAKALGVTYDGVRGRARHLGLR